MQANQPGPVAGHNLPVQFIFILKIHAVDSVRISKINRQRFSFLSLKDSLTPKRLVGMSHISIYVCMYLN